MNGIIPFARFYYWWINVNFKNKPHFLFFWTWLYIDQREGESDITMVLGLEVGKFHLRHKSISSGDSFFGLKFESKLAGIVIWVHLNSVQNDLLLLGAAVVQDSFILDSYFETHIWVSKYESSPLWHIFGLIFESKSFCDLHMGGPHKWVQNNIGPVLAYICLKLDLYLSLRQI